MKKTGLFKIIMFVLLGIVLLSWIIGGSTFENGEIVNRGMLSIGFFDYFQHIFGSFTFSYFLQILIFLVSIGALYGVLNKTGKYRALIDKIAQNQKGIEFVFLIGVSVVIALITSIFDYGFGLFIFFPFIIGIILTMGYDKITACLATFGSILIGTIGNTIGYNVSENMAQVLQNNYLDGRVYKIVLLVLSLIVMIIFLSRAKKERKVSKVSSKKSIDKKEKVIKESTDENTFFVGEKISNKYSVFPIIIVFAIIFVLLVLGCTKWSQRFDVNVFNNVHEKIVDYEVKMPFFHITSDGIERGIEKTNIFSKLMGSTVALGEWFYIELSVICLISAIVLGLCYGMKLKKTFENMANGAIRFLKPALLVILAYSVIYFTVMSYFFPTIVSYILKLSNGFNLFFTSIILIIGSALHVDIIYVANYLLPQLAATGANTTILTILTQSMYGVTMLIAPTSAVIVFGLSYLGIPYKSWIKKVWPITLILFAVSAIVTIVATFIIK